MGERKTASRCRLRSGEVLKPAGAKTRCFQRGSGEHTGHRRVLLAAPPSAKHAGQERGRNFGSLGTIFILCGRVTMRGSHAMTALALAQRPTTSLDEFALDPVGFTDDEIEGDPHGSGGAEHELTDADAVQDKREQVAGTSRFTTVGLWAHRTTPCRPGIRKRVWEFARVSNSRP